MTRSGTLIKLEIKRIESGKQSKIKHQDKDNSIIDGQLITDNSVKR